MESRACRKWLTAALGIVGEGGSGKSTIARMVLRLIEHTVGDVILDSINIIGLSNEALRRTRRDMQLVFQNPQSALNGCHNNNAIGEPLRIQSALSRRDIGKRVEELLVLDESTSALDVSVQAQVLDFLQELRAELNLTYVSISLFYSSRACAQQQVRYLYSTS